MPRKTVKRKDTSINPDDQEGSGQSFVGAGDDRHTMKEDTDPFDFSAILRKAQEASADRKFWEDLRLNSDGLPDLDRFDIQYAYSHDRDGELVDLNKHDSNPKWGGDPNVGGVTDAILTPDATIVNFGQRRSGKSYFSREFCFYMAHFYPRGMVFSDTDAMLHHYDKFFPKKYVYRGYLWRVQEAANRMAKRIKENRQLYDIWKTSQESFMRSLVVYDDVINKDGAFHHNEGNPLRTIFVNGRHYEAGLLFNTQYPRAIPPTMRANIDFSFIFPARGRNESEIIFDLVGGPMQNQKLFNGVLAAHTEDHAMVVVDNQIKARRFVDRFKWYRADVWEELLEAHGMKEEEFKMGCPEYRGEMNNENGVPRPPIGSTW